MDYFLNVETKCLVFLDVMIGYALEQFIEYRPYSFVFNDIISLLNLSQMRGVKTLC